MRIVAAASCLCFVTLTLSLNRSAFAQEAQQAEEQVASGDAIGLPPGSPAGGQTHVVQPGDTLWDLTARYLNNPWYWPKVWAYNPQLSNPHFIYPGTVVRFIPGGDGGGEAPTRVEASAQREMPPQEAQAPAAQTDLVSVSGNRPLTFNTNRSMIVQTVQLVTKRELLESGTIRRALDDKEMLSTFDTVFLEYKKNEDRPKVGQALVSYKMITEVEHPKTGKDVGYLTQITGTLEVTAVGASDKDLVTARVTKTYEPIERGQFIAAQKGPLVGELTDTPNQTKLEGVILTGEQLSKNILAQYHYVFVDRGTQDGVKNGNHFVVIREYDMFRSDDGEKIPPQVVGKIVVVDAKETASLGVITSSLIDLRVGDRVVMR
jgi:LysM domain